MPILTPLISVVVPVYNVEDYLSECIDSLLDQDMHLEIIIVDDGSTDSSGKIADEYAARYSSIKVIHQENKGLSGARNAGFDISCGEYVIFIDSDDYIEKESLKTMYSRAKENDADMVFGRTMYFFPDGRTFDPFAQIAKLHDGKIFRGDEWFVTMLSSGIYYMMVWNYMFRRKWLVRESLHFDPVRLHEDELWTPLALSKAEKVFIMDIPFYRYRQRDGSIMHSLPKVERLKALLYITDRLVRYSISYTFENHGVFKSWLWVDICRLYYVAFGILPGIRDSSLSLPQHSLHVLPRIYRKLEEGAKPIAKKYYKSAVQNLNKYLHWRNLISKQSEFEPQHQRLVLLFNIPEQIAVYPDIIPKDLFLTTDRKYLQEADTVIFYMPDLSEHIDEDIDKPNNQRWIAWFDNQSECSTFLHDEELASLFDETIIIGNDNFLQGIC